MRIRDSLARSVSGIVPPKEVEDIVQETYVRACQLEDRAAMVRPKALLYKVARNLALDHAKRAETRLVSTTEDADSIATAELGVAQRNETLDQVITQEQFADFCVAVRRLPQQRRRAFVLKKVYGYTHREIAKTMQVSEKTVENYIGKAMHTCFEYLNRHGELTADRTLNHSAPRGATHKSETE